MGDRDYKIELYTAQSDEVLSVLRQDGVCYSKESFIQKKYGESAPIFLTAYKWFSDEAERYVPRPLKAGLPYWAFADSAVVDITGGGNILPLRVPIDEVVLFDMYDWKKVLCLQYIGENEGDEKRFHRELVQRGLRESDVVLSHFYPEFRQTIMQSWRRLFRHHERLLTGDFSGVGSVQAALWCIKTAWIEASPNIV